jgi:ribose transport system ATP-binding protein
MLTRLGCYIDPSRAASSLSVPEKQMVEVAKALLREAKLIIMDEPTAVLTPRETENLFAQISRLKASGMSIIYVSHKLDEIKEISDRTTVLRDGVLQGTWDTGDLSVKQIAGLMVGRELGTIYPLKREAPAGEIVLRAENFEGELSSAPVSFEVSAGEILGVAGLVGSGRTELFESLVGLRPRRAGSLTLCGRKFRPMDYRDSLSAGAVYITEDRKSRGLLIDESLPINVGMLDQIISKRHLIDRRREREAGDWAVREFSISTPSPRARVAQLSGGNQQKTLLAKSLLNKPNLIIVDEPTRGIDVGTRAQIYRRLRTLAGGGNAVVVISSDMNEVIGISDRIMVMRENRVAGFVDGAAATEHAIVHLATGLA